MSLLQFPQFCGQIHKKTWRSGGVAFLPLVESKYPCRKCLGVDGMCGTTLSREPSKKLDWWLTDGADIWADFSTLRGARAKVGEIKFDKYSELNWQIFWDYLANILSLIDKYSEFIWQIFLARFTNILGSIIYKICQWLTRSWYEEVRGIKKITLNKIS